MLVRCPLKYNLSTELALDVTCFRSISVTECNSHSDLQWHLLTLFFFLSGTPHSAPPECYTQGSYNALPSTVWTLGLLLYDMLEGDVSTEQIQEIVKRNNITFEIHHSPGEFIYGHVEHL